MMKVPLVVVGRVGAGPLVRRRRTRFESSRDGDDGIGQGSALLATQRAQLVDDLGEGMPLDVAYGIEVNATFAADAVDVHDVRMVQVRYRQRLVREALQLARVHRRR